MKERQCAAEVTGELVAMNWEPGIFGGLFDCGRGAVGSSWLPTDLACYCGLGVSWLFFTHST